MPEKSIWNYEQDVTEPKASRIAVLAKTLGVTADELLGLKKTRGRCGVFVTEA